MIHDSLTVDSSRTSFGSAIETLGLVTELGTGLNAEFCDNVGPVLISLSRKLGQGKIVFEHMPSLYDESDSLVITEGSRVGETATRPIK